MSELNLNPPSGMRDILPTEAKLRSWLETKIVEVYSKFNFQKIETPFLENISNLKKTEGGENLNLIFEVLKRGEKLEEAISKIPIKKDNLIDYGMRYDLTVPLSRYYANNHSKLPNPFKAIQIGSVFRAERPQKGRFRQFTQCDIDIIGIKEESCEIELILATAKALNEIGFIDFTIHINDRRLLSLYLDSAGLEESEHSKAFILIDKLDKIGIEKLKIELNSNFEQPKAEKLSNIIENILKINNVSQINSVLSNDYADKTKNIISPLERVISTIQSLSNNQYKIKFDPLLARGMGYYTGMIFEIKLDNVNYSIAGGGRYDNMIGQLTNRPTPACGFSIGFERVVDLLLERNALETSTSDKNLALIYHPQSDSLDNVIKFLIECQTSYYNVSMIPAKKDLTKQIDNLINGGYSHYYVFKNDATLNSIKQLNK